MILTRRTLSWMAATTALVPSAAWAAPRVGQPAPAFKGVDSDGKTLELSALLGRMVVLEWTNDGCPFVQKWYRSGAMQTLQRNAQALGAVWVSIISSAPGEQGYADGPRANQLTAERNAVPAHVVLDPSGAIGHTYDAQTTPHIFVVNQQGVLTYMGGADSIASTKIDDLARAVPYASNAIAAVAAGRPVADAVTRPYGCTVKYAS